jgi:hypothetical protein
LVLTVGALLSASPALSVAASEDAAARAKARGTLVLQLTGLPPGERGAFTVLGPAQSPGGKPFRRHLITARAVTRLKVSAGVYQVKVSEVELRRSHKPVKRGAAALPVRRKLRIKVAPTQRSTLRIRYGTIINPGVRNVSGHVAKVLGNPRSPAGVVLKGIQVRRGAILSARPNRALPLGLLARATAVRDRGGGAVVRLRPASIYEVAPNMSFDIPLSSGRGAGASQVIKCGDTSGVDPYVDLGDFRASGGWTTSGWGPFKATTGAHAEVRFHAAAGVKVTSRGALSCTLKLPSVGFQGMAGPIPVYGAIRPGATATVGAAATVKAEGSTDITVGAKVSALPPSASPVIDFASPRFEFGASLFAGVKAGLSLAGELGIGAINAANLHVSLTNSLNFIAAPGQCSWDLDLGSFSATGELGPLSISSPSTPPLYHKNLWRRSCGPAPAPPPPPPPPAIALPLVRATMDWDSDSDIDLYVWDDAGNLSYFGARNGIPESELVEDIIPIEGEFVHAREVFQETGSPNRRYTFGICDFAGEGATVGLTVHDPGGGSRSFQSTLFEEGDYEVVTTSPLGGGYVPAPGWCRNLSS